MRRLASPGTLNPSLRFGVWWIGFAVGGGASLARRRVGGGGGSRGGGGVGRGGRVFSKTAPA